MSNDRLRASIHRKLRKYYKSAFPKSKFVPGRTVIPTFGFSFDANDLISLVDSALDFHLTNGRFALQFEEKIAKRCYAKHAMLCNSGSSANLLAVAALTSDQLGEYRLQPGDEVITVAAGFPTTLNPILLYGLLPVFVDLELPTYTPNIVHIHEAIGPKTKAIMLPHTLGNPFNIDAVLESIGDREIWLIEDNCDALGSGYRGIPTGGFGHLATLSFYPAHHITMGEGGCVLTTQDRLAPIVRSFRDWGRDCTCPPSVNNTCGKRFEQQFGTLPYGYDHKYVYSHRGYNLKITDMQAAVGYSQLSKLYAFSRARKRNFRLLTEGLHDLEEFLILPKAAPMTDPNWFGFPITLQPDCPVSRRDLIIFLEDRYIMTRLLFGGNLIRHPAYQDMAFRTVGDLSVSNAIVERTFIIGLYQFITPEMIDYMIEVIHSFFKAIP